MRRVWILLAAFGTTSAVADSTLPTQVITPEVAQAERVWDGVVEAVDQATLAAQTSGRVLELPFDVNDEVHEGQVVVRFTDVEQQAAVKRAKASVDAAEASARQAEADYTRSAELMQRHLIAQSALDQALSARDASRAQLDASRSALREAQQQLDYTVIRAPYTGIVTQRHVQVGETVQPGQALISGLTLGKLRVAVDLPQRDSSAVRQYRQAHVLLETNTGTPQRLPVARVSLFPYADAQSHTFRVRAELPEGQHGLYPGMLVKVAFVTGEAQRLLIPRSALLQRSEISGVYVLRADGQPALRQLRIGNRYGERVEVLAGLDAGETIVLDPALAAAQLAKAAGAQP